jgi:hypothetical protein
VRGRGGLESARSRQLTRSSIRSARHPTQGCRTVDPIGLFSCVSLLHIQAHDLRVRASIDGAK